MPRRAIDALGVPVLAAIGLQLAYPLTHGAARDRITIATVVVVAAASIGHATLTRGRRGLAGCVVAAGVGLSAEVVGVHTGVPFGDYSYSDSLGWKVAGVPIIAGLAWTMLAWPAALVARRLAGSTPMRVLIGGWALASWDLFLDPQLVAAGHWRWAHPDPHLPGVPTVPLTNFAGWLLVSMAISMINALSGRPTPVGKGIDHESGSRGVSGRGQPVNEWTLRADDRWMFALYLWTYLSSIVGLLAFLHLQAAALWGALGMGVVAVPLANRLRAGIR